MDSKDPASPRSLEERGARVEEDVAPSRWRRSRAPLAVGVVAAVLALAVAQWLGTAAGLESYVRFATRGRLDPAQPLVIRDVRPLAPPEWRAGGPVDLRIERGTIAEMTPAGGARIAPGDRTIEGGGRSITGGLCDVEMSAVFRTATRRPLPLDVYRTSLAAQVRSGVTTARDLGSPPRVAAALASAIDQAVLGATIEVGSPWVVAGEPVPDPLDPDAHRLERLALRSADAAASLAAEVRAAGGQWLAVSPGAVATSSKEPLDALASAAKAHRLKLAVWVSDRAALDWALAAGASSIDGFASYDEDLTPDLAEQLAARAAVVVPLAHLTRAREIGSDGAYERDRQTRTIGRASLWGALARIDHRVRALALDSVAATSAQVRNERFRSNLARLRSAGVAVALGTGAPAPFAFQERPADELEELALAGMTGAELLESAISSGNRLLSADDAAGTIAVGRSASLVVWDCDPSADTACFDKPAWVIARGRAVEGRPTGGARPFL